MPLPIPGGHDSPSFLVLWPLEFVSLLVCSGGPAGFLAPLFLDPIRGFHSSSGASEGNLKREYWAYSRRLPGLLSRAGFSPADRPRVAIAAPPLCYPLSHPQSDSRSFAFYSIFPFASIRLGGSSRYAAQAERPLQTPLER